MLQWQKNLHLGLPLLLAMVVAEVVMVAAGTDAETTTEMEVLVLTGIIMVDSVRALIEEHQRHTFLCTKTDERTVSIFVHKVYSKLKT